MAAAVPLHGLAYPRLLQGLKTAHMRPYQAIARIASCSRTPLFSRVCKTALAPESRQQGRAGEDTPPLARCRHDHALTIRGMRELELVNGAGRHAPRPLAGAARHGGRRVGRVQIWPATSPTQRSNRARRPTQGEPSGRLESRSLRAGASRRQAPPLHCRHGRWLA